MTGKRKLSHYPIIEVFSKHWQPIHWQPIRWQPIRFPLLACVERAGELVDVGQAAVRCGHCALF